MLRASLLMAGLLISRVSTLEAQQHPPGAHPPAGDTAAQRDTMVMQHAQMAPGTLGISHMREGSGTSWLPDASPMYAHHRQLGRWEGMLHYNAFLQYIDEGSNRGDRQFGSINWFMGMAQRPLAGGDIRLRAMASLEPITVGTCGYPDLLATGEFCEGEPIHDRQHPHDLFMELAVGYERAITSDLALQLYGGPVGEPALGPVAYPHRISALTNPIAPIGHHWMDATHISFGVATAALFGRRWKVEGSLFNGREPDEDRFDFDLARLDSYAGRLSIMLDDGLVFQISAGRLNDAEPGHHADEASRDVTRTTASAIYHRPLAQGNWASTLVWGQNIEEEHASNAFIAETSLNLHDRNVFFARAEMAEKPGEDLALEGEALRERIFRVGKVQLGYVRQFAPARGLIPGVGASVALNFIPDDLEPFYGGRMPAGFVVFASLRPAPMAMEHVAAAGAPHGATPAGGHVQHQPAPAAAPDSARTDSAHAAHDMMPHRMESGGEDRLRIMEDRLRIMEEMHTRMMSDPVIRERVATDPVLQKLMQGMSTADTTGAHAGHGMDAAAADSVAARQAMEFVTLLLSDPRIEARVHADPKLHRLWSDPQVQRCLQTMRRLKAAAQPLPAACPAAPPTTGRQPRSR